MAVAAKDPSSEVTIALLRDRWISAFGPPAVLMTDQGSEFKGVIEPLLRASAVFHEMVPPTAHWRMSLAERHGAVLKVILMKMTKEQTILGLDDLQTAVVSACAARNRHARAAQIAKEALEELMEQIQSGRVNAEKVDTSSSSSSTSSDEEEKSKKKGKQNRAGAKKQAQKTQKTLEKPAEEQQVWEFSDEELEAPDPVSEERAPDPVSEERVKKASSALDDVPMSLHRKTAASSAAASGARPQKKSRTADDARGDPALRPFIEKRAVYDTAMKQTEKHFKAMKERLEPKPVNVVLPSQATSSNPELVPIPVKPAGPPYFNVHRFKTPPGEPDADQELMEALAFQIDMDVLANINLRPHEDLRRYMPYEMHGDGTTSITRDLPHLIRASENVIRSHTMPPTPSMRSRLPVPLASMQHDVPLALRKPLAKEQHRVVLKRQWTQPPPSTDYWVMTEDAQELCRIHVVPRRATQIFYFHNPISPAERSQVAGNILVHEYPGDPQPRLREFILDNIYWMNWNTQLDLQEVWQGITRFELRPPGDIEQSATLITWVEGRWLAEELWRYREVLATEYLGMREMTGWPNATLMSQRLGPVEMEEAAEIVQFLQNAQHQTFEVQMNLLDTFNTFVQNNEIRNVKPMQTYQGITELTHLPEDLVDVQKPETGKVRLELKWNDLTPRWQEAFQEPILDALKIYFEHDALAPVMPDEIVDPTEILPSRFVLVNKADPRNPHPTDDQLDGAKLKARLVIAGHKDQKAGEYATESPTASLLAHNLLCFLAAQWHYNMFFADISAAFLQGDYLPEGRRVFVQSAESIGGRELALCPGVFGFFVDAQEQPRALLAVHVDDVRLVVDPHAQDDIKGRLNSLFNFGE
eukprot:s2050_g16.t1